MKSMFIAVKLDGPFGTVAQRASVYELQMALSDMLTTNSFGTVSGNEIGNGEAKIFITAPDAATVHSHILSLFESNHLTFLGLSETPLKRRTDVARCAVGDVFLIPTHDGWWSPGQILAEEKGVGGALTCALYYGKVEAEWSAVKQVIKREHLISCLFVTSDLIAKHVWPIVGRSRPRIPRRLFPYEDKRFSGWTGATIVGSRNVAEFVNALYGLRGWDDYGIDPEFFDRMLVAGRKRPQSARLVKGAGGAPNT